MVVDVLVDRIALAPCTFLLEPTAAFVQFLLENYRHCGLFSVVISSLQAEHYREAASHHELRSLRLSLP